MDSYALIDSGNGRKLERFGDHVLTRPCTLAWWKPRKGMTAWSSATAEFHPKEGWSVSAEALGAWPVRFGSFSLLARLQRNGQVGIFPEHLFLADALKKLTRKGPQQRLLNLYAYTGLGSLIALSQQMHTTHVDISKRALGWAKENLKASKLGEMRLIREDALSFVKREGRRENQYDVVVADPPSFSRGSAKDGEDIAETLPSLVDAVKDILSPGGSLVLSTHRHDFGSAALANLCYDYLPDLSALEEGELSISEEDSPRKLVLGYYVVATRRISSASRRPQT